MNDIEWQDRTMPERRRIVYQSVKVAQPYASAQTVARIIEQQFNCKPSASWLHHTMRRLVDEGILTMCIYRPKLSGRPAYHYYPTDKQLEGDHGQTR